ncbi:MAG TPA: 4-hydroxythreonine-4-phosphate dehydrogenase PdxA, partial [Pyrinomonadaceae bacterium]|nr:4-hydroxythreonine-4-phosphate dehydrogenase PdxA [Pyrinomonadaceae bacterium]
MAETLPRIAITMGDPAGIGPEITVKAVLSSEIRDVCVPIVIGDKSVLHREFVRLGAEHQFSADRDSSPIRIVKCEPTLTDFSIGVDSAETGKASAIYIETAVELWRRGEVDAIATAPISKKALSLAGYKFPGHTEFLAHLTGTDRVGMSFFGGNLRVVLLSTHLSLIDAIKKVTTENLV